MNQRNVDADIGRDVTQADFVIRRLGESLQRGLQNPLSRNLPGPPGRRQLCFPRALLALIRNPGDPTAEPDARQFRYAERRPAVAINSAEAAASRRGAPCSANATFPVPAPPPACFPS